MDELINLVAQKAGIPADKSKTAVTTVLGFLKTKLPASVSGQLDSLVAGGGATGAQTGGMADVAKNVGGMFGAKEDRPRQ